MASDIDRLDAIIHLIDMSTVGLNYELFSGIPDLIDATTYRLMHIGENSLHLSQALKDRHPDQPWRLMAGFRNFVAHDYFNAITNVLWTTATEHLASLRRVCALELARIENPGE